MIASTKSIQTRVLQEFEEKNQVLFFYLTNLSCDSFLGFGKINADKYHFDIKKSIDSLEMIKDNIGSNLYLDQFDGRLIRDCFIC